MSIVKNTLLPLITNLATNNKEYVAFVGAGFSKDAGIMSSWDVLIETLRPLYINENKIDEEGDVKILSSDIEKWYLSNDELNKLGYSDILELIYKGDIERREYVSSFFKNQLPGAAHHELAKMVSMGLLRFIFTTNFDDLIEKALDDINIDYDVIYTDDILEKSKSWDKVNHCRIYKLHGDYKSGGIRNTYNELKSLDKKIADDFQYIIDRHGLIVIGYAGRDEGILRHFMDRYPYSYPFYWQYVEYPRDNEEYRLFYELRDKYEKEKSRPIIYIQNPSAAKFLQEITEGVGKLGLLLKMNAEDNPNYEDIIVNSDAKKLRNSTFTILNTFKQLYDDYSMKEEKDKMYLYKFEVFQSLIKETAFIFSYLEGLLKYDCDDEVRFFITNLLRHIISIDENSYYSEFVKNSYPYYIVILSGSLILKYDKEPLVEVFWKFTAQSGGRFTSPLISFIASQGEGWDYIKTEIYKTNFFYPRYTIIRDHLRIIQLKETDIDLFDSYLTLATLTTYKDIRWFNGSSIYNNNSFVYAFEKYYARIITTIDQVEELNKMFYSKHKYTSYRSYDSFYPLITYLREKYIKDDK
jgi:hypothetical protein